MRGESWLGAYYILLWRNKHFFLKKTILYIHLSRVYARIYYERLADIIHLIQLHRIYI